MQIHRLDLQISKILAALVVALYGGAAVILALVNLPWELRVLGVILILVALGWVWRQHVTLTSQHAVVSCWRTADGQWWLQDRAGNAIAASLSGDSICTLYFVLLNFKTAVKHSTLIILPDTLSPESFRQLRVQLRHF